MRTTRRSLAAAVGVAVLAWAAPAAASPASPRIVGGSSVANPGWITLLNVAFADGSTGLCGGELVAKAWVLTAAHCVIDEQSGQVVGPGAVSAWVGVDRQSQATPSTAQAVDRVVVDPAYNGDTSFGDLAAVHLTAPDKHDPVALGGAADPAVGSTGYVLGWGITDSLLQQSSDTLRQVAAPILDASACTGYGASFDAGSMICAGGKFGQDSCNGDSGGPLAYQPVNPTAVLLGTVDYGSNLCGDGSGSVYQRLDGGAGAQFLASSIPTASLALSTTGPPKGGTIAATAAATNLPGATFSWDLNGDGTYGDASGPNAQVTVRDEATSIGVRATGTDGDSAARRITIVPLDTAVSVTIPAHVTEGRRLVLTLARTGPGSGTVTAHATGRGVSVTGQAAIDAGSLALTLPNDHTWEPPRAIDVALTTSSGVALATPATLATTLVDDDKPVVRISSVRRSGAGRVSVKLRAPGAGTLRVRVVRAGITLGKRTVTVTGTSATTVVVAIPRSRIVSLSASGVSGRVSWSSAATPVAKANASRRLRRG